MRRDLSVSMSQANLYSLVIAMPLAMLLLGSYLWLWGFKLLEEGLLLSPVRLLVAFAVFVAGIVLHEAIHALAWIAFGRKRPSAIRFGFALRALAPYAHLTEPVEVTAYRLGGLMPGLLLGFLPWLAGLISGSAPLALFGSVFTISASGDFLVLWLIRKVPAGMLVQDHPSRAGCYVPKGPADRPEP